MRKVLLSVVVLVLFVVGPASAAYLYSSPLTEGLIMSDTVQNGKLSISANIEYFQASDIQKYSYDPDTYPDWASLSDMGMDHFTIMVIPFRFAYGVSDILSVRATVPYVSIDDKGDFVDASASGLGDVRLEALVDLMKQSSTDPGLAINAGVKLATGAEGDYAEGREPLGNRATDMYLSGIMKTKIWRVDTKVLLSYILKGAYEEFDPADQWLASFSLSIATSDVFKFGGEFWFLSSLGEDKIVDYSLKNSNFTSFFFSPFMSVKAADNVSVNLSADLALSQAATFSLADMGLNQVRGTNIILGTTITL